MTDGVGRERHQRLRPHATVVGGRGFIGRNLCEELRASGFEVFVPLRQAPLTQDLGIVFYAAGCSSDYRERVGDTFTADVHDLSTLLMHATYTRIIYCSSTRVYDHGGDTDEDAAISVHPALREDVLTLAKLAGESLIANLAQERGIVVRLSNLIGPDPQSPTFLHTIIRSALESGVIRLQSDPQNERDYLAVTDAVKLLVALAQESACRVYNVGAGMNHRNLAIAQLVADRTGARIDASSQGTRIERRVIEVSRLQSEHPYRPTSLEKVIDHIIQTYEVQRTALTGTSFQSEGSAG